MKQSGRYTYPARFPKQLHATIKKSAKAAGRSMNAQIIWMLAESLKSYPVLSALPVVLHQVDQPFGVRLDHQLHQVLASAAEAGAKGRSFNQELVGRLMVMMPSSHHSLIESWRQLDQALSVVIKQTPSQFELQGLIDHFEWHLKQVLAVDAALPSDQSTGARCGCREKLMPLSPSLAVSNLVELHAPAGRDGVATSNS